MRIPVTTDLVIQLTVNGIDLDVPLLLVLDMLDAYKAYVNTTKYRLVFFNEGVSVPVVRKHGHVYHEWDAFTFYTFPELQLIHRHFFHTDSSRLYALMQRAKDEHAVPQALKNLQDVAAAREVSQRLAKK